MLKFRAFGDVLGDASIVEEVVQDKPADIDFIVFTGDIPNPEIFKLLREQSVLRGDTSEEAVKARIESEQLLMKFAEQVREVNNIFRKIAQSYHLVGVLGNADLQKYLRVVPVGETMDILHKRAVRAGDFFLVGYNGRPLYQFETENRDENAFAEEEIYEDLKAVTKGLDSRDTILVTHAPPYEILDQVKPEYREYAIGTYGERARDGHIGSVGLRKFVDEFEPVLHVFGHIHECKGVYVRDNTMFLNVGSMGEDHEFVEVVIQERSVQVIYQHANKEKEASK